MLIHGIHWVLTKVNRKYLWIGETLLIVGLLAIIIFRNPSPGPVLTADTEKVYRDSIATWQKEAALLQVHIDQLNESYDKLQKSKQTISIRYAKEIQYIDNANLPQLDSILRANW